MKRYTVITSTGQLVPYPIGEYVKFSDVEALQNAEEQLKAKEAALNVGRHMYEVCEEENRELKDLIRELVGALKEDLVFVEKIEDSVLGGHEVTSFRMKLEERISKAEGGL